MPVLVQLSDPHIRLGTDLEAEADAALARSVRCVNDLEFEVDGVLVTGDLTDMGTPDEYARVHEPLAALKAPLHLLRGNHDSDAFGPGTSWVADVAGLRLVGCDTWIEGEPSGHLDLAWLAEQLAAAPATPTI